MIHLYVKIQNKTGKKYFGKTTRNPFKYKGSGIHWKRHIAVHGNDVTTLIIGSYESEDECKSVALKFSEDNNIVDSADWLNLINENGLDGLDGAPQGNVVSSDTKDKISKALTGKSSPKSKYEMSESSEVRAARMFEVTTNLLWITDGKSDKRINKNSDIPIGWKLGRSKTTVGNPNFNKDGNSTRGMKWYNDGVSNIYLKDSDTIPEGYVRGMKQTKKENK